MTFLDSLGDGAWKRKGRRENLCQHSLRADHTSRVSRNVNHSFTASRKRRLTDIWPRDSALLTDRRMDGRFVGEIFFMHLLPGGLALGGTVFTFHPSHFPCLERRIMTVRS